MSPSKILFYFCISFVAGVFFESVFKIPQVFIWGFLFLALILIFGFLNKKQIWVLGFCVIFFTLGILRLQILEFNIAINQLKKLNDKGQITLAGVITDEPDIREAYQRIKVKTDKGTVLATVKKYPEYQYFDKVALTGKLETPQETEDFSYKNYLMKDGIYSVMYFPKMEAVGKEPKTFSSTAYSWILKIKQKLRQSIRSNYSPPQSLVLEGTVLGNNGVMSQELKDKLNATGLRHIIAVSGTHIVILSSILMSFLIMIGLWRRQAFYFSVALIWFYIVLTGLAPSGVRAGIMGTLFLMAEFLGRQSAGSRIITMAAAVMLLQNPFLLFYDVGFQLSFLAALGIIYISPILKNIFKKITQPQVLEMICSTLAAQIFTLPIMLYNFGNISLIAPITNILVLPMVPLMMIFGFLSSFVGIFSQILGFILAWPCWVLLSYFVKITDIFSQPWAIKSFQNVHWIWVVVLYVAIGYFTAYINKKYRQNFI